MLTGKPAVATIVDAATSTGLGSSFQPWGKKRVFQVIGSVSSGSGSSDIDIEGSLDGNNWVKLNTFNLTLSTTVVTEKYVTDEPWKYIRGNVTAISGTGASVSLFLGNVPF